MKRQDDKGQLLFSYMTRQTSIDAYNAIKENGILSARRWEAYHELYHRGPLTGQELARNTHTPGMWKRCSELAKAGVVQEVGTRICEVTGQHAIIWDVTSFIPTKDHPQD